MLRFYKFNPFGDLRFVNLFGWSQHLSPGHGRCHGFGFRRLESLGGPLEVLDKRAVFFLQKGKVGENAKNEDCLYVYIYM